MHYNPVEEPFPHHVRSHLMGDRSEIRKCSWSKWPTMLSNVQHVWIGSACNHDTSTIFDSIEMSLLDILRPNITLRVRDNTTGYCFLVQFDGVNSVKPHTASLCTTDCFKSTSFSNASPPVQRWFRWRLWGFPAPLNHL